MTILITGGAGFIGSHLIEELYSYCKLIIVDDLSTGKIENLANFPEIIFYNESITNLTFLEKLFTENKIDAVVHLAAIASVFKCVEKPIESSEVNFKASINLMELSSKNNVSKFIFASSAAVYGSDPRLPKSEVDSTTLPISTYGIDKFAAEQYLMDYSRRGKLKGTAFRFFNVFGERQDPTSPYSGVLSIFTDQIKLENPQINIFGDGNQTRDFIYIKDITSAIKVALENDSFSGNVFNLGTGTETSLLNVVSSLETISSKKIAIKFEDARLGDIEKSTSDISKIKSFGWSPKFSFLEGLKKYYNSL